MAISLVKGQKVTLAKDLGLARIGIGWDCNEYGSKPFDLDSSAFLLTASGKVGKDEDFIFYGNKVSECGSVIHSDDNQTGEGAGDDEVIIIDLNKVPQTVERIAITVTIDKYAERNQCFGQVSNAYVSLVKIASPEQTSGEEVLRYDLTEDYSIETSLMVCEIYRHNGEWKFNAIGAGLEGGLAELCAHYGVDTE